MAGSKEIRNKIKSVQSTRKITKAMEMVAASKMKEGAGPDARVAARTSRRPSTSRCISPRPNTEYRHPFLNQARPGQAHRLHRRHDRQGACAAGPQHQRAAGW